MILDDCRLKEVPTVAGFAKWNRDVVSLFEEQVGQSPEAAALVAGTERLSYSGLNVRANRLARYLVGSGVAPGSYVGICVERSFDAIVGVLAILKCGAAYVPIDHQYPLERMRFILDDSGASPTLTARGMSPEVTKTLVRPVWIDDTSTTERYGPSNLGLDIPAASPAYVMYTSGTTGSPKAAAIPQSGISRLVKHANYIHLDSSDVVLHHSTCAFDAATFEIWSALLNGGSLVIHRPSFDLDTLGPIIRNHGVTTLLLTTSVFHLVAENKPESLATLRQVVTGGDVLQAKVVRKLIAQYPHLTIFNGYGPTENATFTCCYVITRETEFGETLPIGRPINGTNVFILDEQLRRVDKGEVGQLYTNGLGLARGYLNRPDLTEQHFVKCPFPEAGDVLYRTGDLVREDPQGNLHFVGRIDRQLKIRGFRVEPGEIEHAINVRSDVAESLVLAEGTHTAEKRLVAYVKRSEAASALNAEEIKQHLASRVPHYMVPAEVHVLDEFPLTTNGKIDKETLRRTLEPRERSAGSKGRVGGAARIVLDVWRKQLQTPMLQLDSSIYDHGASSLTIMVVQSELNARLHCQVEPIELARAQTPNEWTKIYESCRTKEKVSCDGSKSTGGIMNAVGEFKLTQRQLKDFDRDGFIGPFQLYSPGEMAAIYKQVRAQLFNRKYAPYETAVDSAIANYDRHLDVSLLSQHICRPEIVERLQGILGDDVLCWRSEFIPKPPGAEGTDWHQADTFEHASGKPQLVWPAGEEFGGTINVWTAFTEATEENGCLLFVPGTHREMHYDESKGLTYDPARNVNVVKDGIPRGFNGYDYRKLQKDPNWKPDESRAAAMVMKPGEFIMFRSTLLHASKPNSTTNTPRLGYVARYVPTRVKVYPDTDVINEFGGEISLKNYGTVVVSGRNVEPGNRVRTENLRGERFAALV